LRQPFRHIAHVLEDVLLIHPGRLGKEPDVALALSDRIEFWPQ
jgi:hypothetical protein